MLYLLGQIIGVALVVYAAYRGLEHFGQAGSP